MLTLKDFIHRLRCHNHLNASITDSGSERVNMQKDGQCCFLSAEKRLGV